MTSDYLDSLAHEAAMRVPVKALTEAIAVAEAAVRRAEDKLYAARARKAAAVARLAALRAVA